MVKKVMAVAVMVLLWCSGAWSATELWYAHDSVAKLTNGETDYSAAYFSALYFTVIHTDTPVTKETAHLTGSITLSGGRYSFWNGKEIQKVSGTPMTYKLGLETWLVSGDEAAYQPFNDAGGELKCGIESDSGLNGVTMSWNFPDDPSMNGTFTLPNHRTTQEQLNNGVLYFEFIRSGDVVTGINWRVVKASDTSTPVSQEFGISFYDFEVWNYDDDKILKGRPEVWIDAGANPEGVYAFETPIKESDICHARTRLNTYGEDGRKRYTWDYYVQSDPGMYLWKRHASDASLINGKSDYSGAKFSNVFFIVENSNTIDTEARHFTDTGRVTIPGGGYTLVDADTGETLSTVTGDATMKLRFDSEGGIGDDYLEYWLIDDSGNLAAFAGTETALNGKTISWTFPGELANLSGSGVIPNYKTTAQQLATGVPYVEIVSEDGYITAVNYKIVTASDTSTAITPNHRTDFRIYFDRATGKDVWANTYRSGWIRNTSSGTLTLDIPQPLSIVKRVRVRLRSYEESADNPAVYQWNFYPASAPIPLEITTTSLPDATINAPYSVTLNANIPGVSWRVSSGTLPAGLTLNPSTGVISGTPTSAGTSTFKVTAEMPGYTGAEKQLSLTVSQTPTITITTTSLPSGIFRTAYSATLTSSTTGASWSVSSGTLPDGLTLSTSGTISGTPNRTGTYTFTVRAVYGSATAEKQFTVTISVKKPVILTPSLPDGKTGTEYTATLEADDSPVRWSISSGTLPPELTLNSSTGAITGTPTTAGTYTFTVRVVVHGFIMTEKQFSITVEQGSTGVDNNSSGGCSSFPVILGAAILAFIMKRR